MVGTKAGGVKAKITNIKRHGEDYYHRIGKKGGQNSHTGGFGSNVVGKDGLTGRERARIAGRKGGLKAAEWYCGHEVTSEASEERSEL